ncbi:MAG: ROK family transcriptional regulator [Spirochaetales bacterium]|nr:ROK family transcriptional regulator [Spirochaetales bacterium]
MADSLRVEDIRQFNIKSVLSLIHDSRNAGGLSQSDVVSRLTLKAPTVFRIFNALEADGFISPCASKSTSDLPKSGRRPTYYNINDDACYELAVEFWSNCISVGVFNFACDVIYSDIHSLKDSTGISEVIDTISSMVGMAISKTGIDKDKIIGLGVAAPGKVSVSDGKVIYYGRIPGLEDYPLKDILEQRTGLKVLVHNNCSAIAYSLYNSRSKTSSGSLFAFLLRSGVNGSLVNENGIFLSADNTTLEAGHLIVKPDGVKCNCGMCGCLQAQLLDLDKDYGDSESSFKSLFDSIPSGEKGDEIVRKAADYLFIAVKDIQRFSAPDSFLIICSSAFVAERIAACLRGRLAKERDFFAQNDPAIIGMGYDTSLALRGATELVFADFFGK